MNVCAHPVIEDHLETARAIVKAPVGQFTRQQEADACHVLRSHGDFIDYTLAEKFEDARAKADVAMLDRFLAECEAREKAAKSEHDRIKTERAVVRAMREGEVYDMFERTARALDNPHLVMIGVAAIAIFGAVLAWVVS